MKSVFRLIFIFFFCFDNLSASINPSRLIFEHFAYEDQLPSNSINRIYNDSEGYMWFGSKDGLCRFDGYRVKVFRSSSTNPNRLTSNGIQSIAEDNNSRIWVGTLEGVNILDKKNYSIKHLSDPFVGRDRINSIFKDKSGRMWIATANNGLIRIFKNGQRICFSNKGSGKYYLSCNNVRGVYQDSRGRIWALMQNNGLALFSEQTGRFTSLPAMGNNNNPFRMIEDRPDHFLICTWGDGMFAMDLKALPGNPFTKLTILKDGKQVPVNDISYSIIKDNKVGYVWVVSFTGLLVLERVDDHTYNLVDSESMFPGPYYKLFHEIIQDRQGNLWLGSVGDGIFKLNFNNSSLQTNSLNKLKESLGFPPIVVGFCESADGFIYVVINRRGLQIFNPKTGDIIPVQQQEIKEIQSISTIKRIRRAREIWLSKEGVPGIFVISDRVDQPKEVRFRALPCKGVVNVTSFCEDREGNVWIGADNGLYRRDAGSDRVVLINPHITNISVISEDKKGNIWVGSDKHGIIKLGKKSGSSAYTVITAFSKTAGNLQINSIQSICCRKNGEVCIGTRVGSIYFYDEKSNTMLDVSRLYGITEESVLDILEDNSGTLWISTIKKIIRFNPVNHVTTYYTKSDGILVSSFAKDACIKLENGTMMFGGNKGLCYFIPGVPERKPTSSQKVYITDIELKNQSIFDNDKVKHYDADNQRLILQSTDDDMTFEFSALNLTSADKIQYAYKLNGINKDWIYVGNNRRFVSYANLPSGKYTFMVKATDEAGTWSDQITSLEIIKYPPFYRSWWAYIIYLMLIALCVYFIYNRIRMRNLLKISRIEKEKSEELAQTKLRYFTNISHDLLTPLTIISLLTGELSGKYREDHTQIDQIKANVNRLRRLIKQILAFRKVESGNMQLKVKQADIVAFVREVCYSNFQPLLKEKELEFSIESQYDSLQAFFDPDKLDKVLYNLLSNAIKFTPSHGTIQVKMTFPFTEGMQYVCLSVSDTGKGIDEQDLPHIFTRFYISHTSDQSQSNGIGLALTHDLLQIHKGEIRAESLPGKGTCFSLRIPLSKAAYTDEEFSDDEITVPILKEQYPGQSVSDELQVNSESLSEYANALLVVEDNKELNQIIVDHFRQQYRVFSAENGIQALTIIAEYEVDLVISDVMMPEMDGLTLCQHIKSDISTSHIDVLLLTAKSTTDDQVDYFNAGAEAYIPKPFDLKVLSARVRNLIAKRRQKTDRFKTNKEVNISAMEYNSLDEEFLKQSVEVIERKLAEMDFDFDQFARDMNSSKSTLHRKLKSLTGLSPGEFIRNIRLKHACQMLAGSTIPISDVAYAVGFNNPKYFSSCFKNEFGISPREYRDEHGSR